MEKSPKLSKIINDPVHGFIELPRGIILDLIDTPVFQRLRRIKQLGLSTLVYPGAVHTRFNHALGAMHLMRQALDVLKRKKVEISKKEYKAALIAILMHDVGHGPFSHALEHVIIPGLHHERLSLAMMRYLNKQFKNKLSLAIDIFEGNYHRPFLHQLVSSQLDMDRMDYLVRDSFFTGVVEGMIGVDRIIKILNVFNEELVCEDKGIYSLEKFVVSRRLMYWQVYLHKAAMAAEHMLVHILKRVRALYEQGKPPFMDENLRFFFEHQVDHEDISKEVIERYIQLDDNDIEFAVKKWQFEADKVLSELCQRLLSRNLLKIRISEAPFSEALIAEKKAAYQAAKNLNEEEAEYFFFTGKVTNQAYLENSNEPINIYYKSGKLTDLAEASDIRNVHALATSVVKYYACFPEGYAPDEN
ncbi:MAG: HD domain-containing protein [Bacteroidota bacterium]